MEVGAAKPDCLRRCNHRRKKTTNAASMDFLARSLIAAIALDTEVLQLHVNKQKLQQSRLGILTVFSPNSFLVPRTGGRTDFSPSCEASPDYLVYFARVSANSSVSRCHSMRNQGV